MANEYYYSYEQSEDLTDLKFITGARNKELSLAPLLANGQIRKLGQGRIGDTYLMDYSHELALALRSCINHHKIIVKAHSMMEDFLNPLLLCASFQAPLQICTMAFTLTKVKLAAQILSKHVYSISINVYSPCRRMKGLRIYNTSH